MAASDGGPMGAGCSRQLVLAPILSARSQHHEQRRCGLSILPQSVGQGYRALASDLRAHGDSGGQMSTFGALVQVFAYTLRQAAAELARIHTETGGFVEHAPPPNLPEWAHTPGRTSDAYLVQVAASLGMKLATLDGGINDPAAELIP